MIVSDLCDLHLLKRSILPAFLLSFCISCNMKPAAIIRQGDIQAADPVEGVWKLTNQYLVKDGDTLYLGPEEVLVRHKIYVDGFVICTDAPTADSEGWYGYGTYNRSNGTLTENLETISLPMKAELGGEDHIVYQIELEENFLKQETSSLFRRTSYMLVDEWRRLNH